LGFKVRFARIRLGNAEVDGEVEGKGWMMALEIKTPSDDLTRGLGQLVEALVFGYKALFYRSYTIPGILGNS
jgi:hypothetical protein